MQKPTLNSMLRQILKQMHRFNCILLYLLFYFFFGFLVVTVSVVFWIGMLNGTNTFLDWRLPFKEKHNFTIIFCFSFRHSLQYWMGTHTVANKSIFRRNYRLNPPAYRMKREREKKNNVNSQRPVIKTKSNTRTERRRKKSHKFEHIFFCWCFRPIISNCEMFFSFYIPFHTIFPIIHRFGNG